MNREWLAACCAAWFWCLASEASAQPILKRVEELVREQLGAARSAITAEPGYLGLIGDDTPDASGVVLLEVYPEQPAERAGLVAGDVITSMDGRNVRSMDEMQAVLGGKNPGDQIPVRVQRDGRPQDLVVTLGRKPVAGQANELPEPQRPPAQAAPPAGPRLGVRTVPVTPEVQRQNGLPDANGAQVVSVAVDSAAARAGIPLGAVITAVNGQPIRTPEELAETIRNLKVPEATVRYVQGGRAGEAIATVASAPAEGPLRETRARPPQPGLLQPAEVQPAGPAAEPPSRLEALERRMQQLEQRIKELEAKDAGS